MASESEIRAEFVKHWKFDTRHTPDGVVHAYMLGDTRAAICRRAIRVSWQTDEDPTCDECLMEIERLFKAYMSTRVKEWWTKPPFYTGKHLEKIPGKKPKVEQDAFDLGEIDVPIQYRKVKNGYEQ